jgi:ABC-type hemin transport system ATPase subunit
MAPAQSRSRLQVELTDLDLVAAHPDRAIALHNGIAVAHRPTSEVLAV